MFPVFSSMLKREKTQSAEKMVREVDVHSSNLFPPIILLLLLLASASASATETFSDQLHPCLSIARTLLQAQQGCPVNFEILNYTIITSRCKGPKYPPNICCEAFKDFACPYADQLNDQTNNCATTLFSYINLYGHYPPGLFANECRDTKRGLECTQSQSSPHHDAPAPSAAAIPTIFHHWIYLLSLLFSYRLFIS